MCIRDSCRDGAAEDQDVAVGMAVAAEGLVGMVMVSCIAGSAPCSGLAGTAVPVVPAVLTMTAAARWDPTASAGTAAAAATAED